MHCYWLLKLSTSLTLKCGCVGASYASADLQAVGNFFSHRRRRIGSDRDAVLPGTDHGELANRADATKRMRESRARRRDQTRRAPRKPK